MTAYLKQFSIATLLLLLGFVCLNWFTDPFAIWHNHCVDGLNCRKTEAGDKVYLTKAYQWQHVKPDVIILGNSRSELGLDPKSPHFAEQHVYNLGIRGAGFATQVKYLINLLQQHNPERVILSLDALDFLQPPESITQWPPKVDQQTLLPLTLEGGSNPYYPLNNIKSRLKSLLALDSTLSSLKTLTRQQQQSNHIRLDGFNQADGFIPIVNYEGTQALFEQKEQALLKQLSGKQLSLLDPAGESASFNTLALLIDALSRRSIKLDLFISPYHQRYLDILAQTEHSDLYLAWKQELVHRLSSFDFFSQNRLLDFSGFNRYTTEPIPINKGSFMRWYWEPSHYRAELGEIIIQHIISNNQEFELTPTNVIAQLAKEKALMNRRHSTLVRAN